MTSRRMNYVGLKICISNLLHNVDSARSPAFRSFGRRAIYQCTITQWLITSLLSAGAPRSSLSPKNSIITSSSFHPGAVCCQIAGKLEWLHPPPPHFLLLPPPHRAQSGTSTSFSSTRTIVAVTSGIKFEQEDHTAAHCRLDLSYRRHVRVKTKSVFWVKATRVTLLSRDNWYFRLAGRRCRLPQMSEPSVSPSLWWS